MLTGSVQAQDEAGVVFDTADVFKKVNATTGSLEADATASLLASASLSTASASFAVSHSLVRTSLTSSKTESDLVAKGFGEKAVVSASAFAQGAEATASALAIGAEESSSVNHSASFEFTREQTKSLADFSLGAVVSGSTASTQSFLAAVLTASISSSVSGGIAIASASAESVVLREASASLSTASSSLSTASASLADEIHSSIVQLTSSLSESRAIMVSSSAGIDYASSSAIIRAQNITDEGIAPIKDDVTSSFSQLGVVSSSFGSATASIKTIVTESFTLNSSSIDFAATGSQVKNLD